MVVTSCPDFQQVCSACELKDHGLKVPNSLGIKETYLSEKVE